MNHAADEGANAEAIHVWRHPRASHLRRCADVGRWLRRWGWIHRIDASIAEIHFGDWEGRSWDDIGQSKLDEWVADFAAYAPGGGESLLAMLERAASWHTTEPVVVIGHAGWMLARRWLEEGRDPPASAAQWPKAPKHGSLWRLSPIAFVRKWSRPLSQGNVLNRGRRRVG